MKAAMNYHVDQQRSTMFQNSADEIKDKLKSMIRNQEEIMSNRADEIFVLMRRDYCSVLGGGDTHGEGLPKAQRLIRSEVNSILEGVENMFKEVIGEESDDTVDPKPDQNKKEEEVDTMVDEKSRFRQEIRQDNIMDGVDTKKVSSPVTTAYKTERDD